MLDNRNRSNRRYTLDRAPSQDLSADYGGIRRGGRTVDHQDDAKVHNRLDPSRPGTDAEPWRSSLDPASATLRASCADLVRVVRPQATEILFTNSTICTASSLARHSVLKRMYGGAACARHGPSGVGIPRI